jgi:hypothetical protein
MIAERARGMTISRFVSDVETSTVRQTVKLASRLFPGESGPRLLVIQQVRGDPAPGRRFGNWFTRHLASPKICPRISERCNYQAKQEQPLFMPFSAQKLLTY